MEVYYFLYIRQSQTKALDIVAVAGMDAIELLKDFPEVLLLDADTCIADGDRNLAGRGVPCSDIDIERLVWLAVFYSVVDKIEYNIAEMCFLYVYIGFYRFYFCIYFSACMFYT